MTPSQIRKTLRYLVCFEPPDDEAIEYWKGWRGSGPSSSLVLSEEFATYMIEHPIPKSLMDKIKIRAVLELLER